MDAMKKINILLADDDDEDRRFFSEAITQLNLNIVLHTVENGRDLMEYLNDSRKTLPDIIFLDLYMPKMGGIQCLTQIRNSQKLKEIAVVIYSVSSTEEDIEACLVSGANIYLRRPTEIELLKALLYKAITVNHHYDISGHSKENFVMVI